jgi:hypothetical protein
MIVKAALIFLAAMLVLGVFGRWSRLRRPRDSGRVQSAQKCPDCGAYLLGASPEPCARADCPSRR